MITLPALQMWLGQELEMRGIDAVIYTRYILSILQQESFEPDSEFDPFVQAKEWRSSTKGTRAPRKYRRSWTADDWKKNAVLECLQGVTDKECGIESLVEELCVKLKRVKEERDRGTRDGGGTSDEDKPSPVKPEEKLEQNDNPEAQAAKYYQAFPALSDKTNTLMASEPKPHGAWGANKKSLSPDGQREVVKRDRRAYKSVSACVSRGSKSPTRKHQRAKSLPSSQGCPGDNLLFVVPKYQTKKGCARKQTEGGVQVVRSGDKTRRVEDKTLVVTKPSVQAAKSVSSKPSCETKEKASEVLYISLSQSPEFLELVDDDVVDEEEISWYMEPVIPVLDQGKMQSRLDTVYRSGSGSPCVKTPDSDISLEDAVNSLAESLCRDIFDDVPQNTVETSSEGWIPNRRASDVTNSQCVPQQVTYVHGLLEGDSAERGRHGVKPDLLSLLDSGKPDLYASQGRNASSLQAMPVLVVDSQASLSLLQGHYGIGTEADSVALQTLKSSASSSQEHLEGLATDLMTGARPLADLWDEELPTPSEPWERPPYQVATSVWESDQGSSLEMSSEQGLPEGGKQSKTQDVPDSLQVQVDHGKMPNSLLGSSQGKESLLRICCPTHSHHLCSSTSGLSEFRPGHFPFSEETFVSEAPLPSPSSVLSFSEPGSPFYSESEQDSLAKGIKSACHLDDATPVAADAQPFDINSALWSTYDTQSRYPHPPKIVHWQDKSFAKDGVLRRRKSSFIEGGVYGSPYSSQNNSHYNSCSTSPCESGSMRDLWNPSAVQEVSSLVTSMHELISPQSGPVGWRTKSRLSDASSKCGAATPEHMLEPSQQDEQSLIEDSLVDSPVFICSRSSSRFEFARSVSDLDGSLSPVSAAGTETDDMVSEAELLEEIFKDEESQPQACNKDKVGTKDDREFSDSLKHSFPTDGSSQDLTPSWLTPPPKDAATCFSDDPCSEKSQHSLSLTGIVPSISKPEAVRKGKRPFDLAVGGSSPMRQKTDQVEGSLAMDELLISPKTHFRPIHETISPDDSSGDDAANETKLMDSPHPVSESHMNKAVGSPIRKSPTTKEWSIAEATEQSTFHTGSSRCVSSKAKSFGYPQSRRMKYASLPWIRRRNEEHQQETDDQHHEEASVEAELNPMMNLTYENQIFAFEDEDFLQGEVLPEVTSGSFKPLYSSELEEMLLGEAAGNGSQGRPPWRKHRRKTGVHKKPCSFFLEGKCRRAECPFAHDVSQITCRFWEEGQCLKGQECPFLHSYPSGIQSSEDTQYPGSRYGQVDSRTNQRREGQDDTRWAHAQVGSASPILTTEGAVPRGNPLPAKVGPVPTDSGPNHARSLPIRIHFKPR